MLVETFKPRKMRYLLTLFSFLCLLVLPYAAYAAEQGYGSFWYGPNEQTTEGVKYTKTGVVASNKYDAALYALGFGKSTVTGISNSKKNKLIANSTFSSFANGFKTGKPDDDLTSTIPGVPTIGLNMNSMLSAWYAASAMYGDSNCYWSIYSKDSADTVYDVASKIIKGGSSTGPSSGPSTGGGSGNLGQTVTLYYTGLNGQVEDYDTVQLDIKEDTLEIYNSYIEEHPELQYFFGTYNRRRPLGMLYLIMYDSRLTMKWDGSQFLGLYNDTDETLPWYRLEKFNGLTLDGNVLTAEGGLDSNKLIFTENISPHSSKLVNNWNINYVSYTADSDSGSGDEPTEPPVEWPDPKPTPTPPEPPDPVTPDPPTPWSPIPGIDIDITGDDFQDLLDALNEHCIHLQTSINDNVSQLWQLQSELFTNQMNTFWDNLHNDLLWLGECLNFDVTVNVDGGTSGGDDGGGDGDTNTFVPFDDSSVIYWLKQIWSKLGNGISTRPVDPVINPDGWWDWFANLLGGLIGALADIGLDKIGGLVDALDTLKDKFPFCVPWDIAALLGLLVSEPVTPVIEVPLMALSVSNGVQQVGSMVIDLDAYNDAWEAVRWIERIAFCVYLATRTKDFLDLLGKIKG